MQLLVRPGKGIGNYGFDLLAFKVERLAAGERCEEDTGGRELGIVVLGGRCSIDAPGASWPSIGARANVFSGLPYVAYIPIATHFEITAETECDLAFCYSRADKKHPPKLVTPDDIEVEIRGGGNATRQINHIFKPDFPSDRLLLVEVYTPSGNWSSYPPHKHDVHNPPVEADLEEIYYYRIDNAAGYAIQKVYTADRRIDETMTVRDGDMVLVPEGYHPVVAAPGYNVYYLNALAGSVHSMAATDDPEYAWVRHAWGDRDPRLPLVRRTRERSA